jgi:hypothetical protein
MALTIASLILFRGKLMRTRGRSLVPHGSLTAQLWDGGDTFLALKLETRQFINENHEVLS